MTEVAFPTCIRHLAYTNPCSNLLAACRGQKEPQVHTLRNSTRLGTKAVLYSQTEIYLTVVTQTQAILQFAAGMPNTGKLEGLSSSEATTTMLQNRYVSGAV